MCIEIITIEVALYRAKHSPLHRKISPTKIGHKNPSNKRLSVLNIQTTITTTTEEEKKIVQCDTLIASLN